MPILLPATYERHRQCVVVLKIAIDNVVFSYFETTIIILATYTSGVCSLDDVTYHISHNLQIQFIRV